MDFSQIDFLHERKRADPTPASSAFPIVKRPFFPSSLTTLEESTARK
jgi:hypothetical protein